MFSFLGLCRSLLLLLLVVSLLLALVATVCRLTKSKQASGHCLIPHHTIRPLSGLFSAALSLYGSWPVLSLYGMVQLVCVLLA